MRNIVKILLSVILFAFANTVFAQIDTVGNSMISGIDSLRFTEIEGKSFKILPYVAPSYSPETEWLFSAGGLITFKVQNFDRFLNLSSIPFSIGYSTNGSFTVRVLNVIYWTGDQIRSIGEFQLRNMPDNYWGIGYDNGVDISKPESQTSYTRKYWRFFQHLMFRTGSNIFVGVAVDFNRTRSFDMNPFMAADDDVQIHGNDVYNTGLGFVIDFDSRDFVQNAYEGMYLSGSFLTFNSFLGGDSRYSIVDLDYRQYIKIKRERRILAWQVKSRLTFSGTPPWSDKAMLGGMDNMRGYTMGRFRDDNMMLATVEYRHMFMRKRLNKKGNYNSRFGYVAWLGAGSVASAFSNMAHWLPNGGAGLRFELQPRMNIRVDYGIGKEEKAVYVTFSEVF